MKCEDNSDSDKNNDSDSNSDSDRERNPTYRNAYINSHRNMCMNQKVYIIVYGNCTSVLKN